MSLKKGHTPWNKGIECPQIARAMIGNKNRLGFKDTPAMLKAKQSRSGENSPVWKGGKPKCSVCEKELRYGRKNCRLHNRGNTSHGMTADPAYVRWSKNKRNRMLRTSEGSHTYQEWLEVKNVAGNECVICHTPESVKQLTQDHIIPVSKGGTDFIENIQPLCMRCNATKSNKLEVMT